MSIEAPAIRPAEDRVRTHEANNFTPLRLTLATMVLLAHFRELGGASWNPWPFIYADPSVDGFFVVSGFLIFASFDAAPRLAPFYLRRFFRLYPLYIAVVLAQAAAMLALQPDGPRPHLSDAATYIGASAMFSNFLHYDIGHILAGQANPGINPSVWTLKIEVAFYAIVPLIWFAWRRWGVAVLAALFAASVLYGIVLHRAGMFSLAKQLPGQLQFFAAGIGLYVYRDRLLPGPIATWAAIALLGLAVTLLFTHSVPLRRHDIPGLYPCLIAALVFLLACRTPPIGMTRDISFGVYLLHGPVIQISLLLGWYSDSAIGLAATVAVVFGLALIAEIAIERPFIALGRRVTSNRGAAAPALAPAAG